MDNKQMMCGAAVAGVVLAILAIIRMRKPVERDATGKVIKNPKTLGYVMLVAAIAALGGAGYLYKKGSGVQYYYF